MDYGSPRHPPPSPGPSRLGGGDGGSTMELSEVQRDVESRAAGMPARLVERIAERLGGMASATAVYGAPVERDGVTVIPVARVQMGFGAGGGTGTSGAQETGSGGGGGGGVMATPMGFISISNGHAEFHPIQHPIRIAELAPVIAAGGFAAWLALTGLRRLFRG